MDKGIQRFSKDNTGLDKLTGEIVSVVFNNPDNGFTVVKIVDAAGAETTARGVFPLVAAGQMVELYGTWENHNEYGMQFAVQEFKYVLPTTNEGVERFLGSGLIPGIGPKLAISIVDYFGDRTVEILNTKPGRLRESKKSVLKKQNRLKRDGSLRLSIRSSLSFCTDWGCLRHCVKSCWLNMATKLPRRFVPIHIVWLMR